MDYAYILECEYEIIFLSTAEPTEDDGRSKNPTTSPCAQQVFNTVITRAKSLVVCAGNPLLLMTTEKFMNNEAFCWKEYIKRCLLNKTFNFPPKLFPVTEKYTDYLLRLIFTPSYKAIQFNGDKILQSLYEEIRKCYGNGKLFFDYAKGKYEVCNKVSGKYSSTKLTGNINYELKRCTIEIKSKNLAIAYNKSNSITIEGFRNRRGAFDGDTVDVAVFEGNRGRVVRVVESNHCETFVCKADSSNVVFTPVDDETAPKFNNIPWISKDMQLDSWQKKYICIFNEEKLHMESILKVKDLIPHSNALNLLFVVKFIKWKVRCRNAWGAVIEALPVTTSPFFSELLLQFTDSLPPDNTIKTHESYHKSHSIVDESLCYNSAFTIDLPTAENLDDAISLEPCKNSKEGAFELAILITSVSEDITEDMATYAEQRVCARNRCQYPILPFDYCEQFSLKPGQLCKVIAIKADVIIKDDSISISNVLHERAKIKSQLKLDYKNAQHILNGKKVDTAVAHDVKLYDKNNTMSLKEQLSCLLKIAQHLRVERLGSRGYYYDCNDEESKWWQSHLIVEELMIWANRYIAQHVLRRCPNIAILRIQSPPSNDEKLSLQAKYDHIFDMEEIWPIRESANELIVPLATLEKLKDLGQSATRDRSAKVEFLYALFNCNLYPQLAAVERQQCKISQTAKYLCSNSDDQYHLHYSLGCDPYTHFTSPLRRYCDLVMQTILLNGAGSYTPEKIEKICAKLNVKARHRAHYEEKIEGVILVRDIEVDMKQSQAFVIHTGNEFELYFPPTQYKCIKSKHTSFTLSNLQCTNGKWLVVSGSLQQNNIFKKMAKFKKASRIHVARSSIKVNWEQNSDCESITATTFTSSATNGHKKMQHFVANVVSHVIKLSWRSAHECVVSPTETNIKRFLNDLRKLSAIENVHSSGVDKYDKMFCDSSVIVYEVHKLIKEFNSVKVWLGRSVSDIDVPTPTVCLIEVAPTVTICVQHNISPAQCFSDVQLTSALRKTYYSMNQYVDMWNKVLLAEAVNDITSEKAIFMIRNVTLDWGELDAVHNAIDNMHYTPKGLVTFKIPEQSDITYFIEIKVGCCICARFCQEGLPNAVYHFVVNKVGNDDLSSEGIEISLKAEGNASCRLSPEFKSSIPKQVCDMQIIKTPISFQ